MAISKPQTTLHYHKARLPVPCPALALCPGPWQHSLKVIICASLPRLARSLLLHCPQCNTKTGTRHSRMFPGNNLPAFPVCQGSSCNRKSMTRPIPSDVLSVPAYTLDSIQWGLGDDLTKKGPLDPTRTARMALGTKMHRRAGEKHRSSTEKSN